MSSPASKTVVFVPGAWHNPACFSVVAKQLRDAGYGTRYISLPSVREPPFLKDFSEDVAKIRSTINSLADEGREIILVVHSYGGVPASQAIQNLDIASRQKQGLKGGVVHLFFCCSFIIPDGESLVSAFGGSHPSWYSLTADGTGATPNTPAETFYNDMPPDEVEAAVAMLRPFSIGSSSSTLTYLAWRDVPSTYLYCLRDQAMPVEAQRMMVEQWAEGRFGVKMRTETVDAGHSPFHSKPDEMAAAIRRAAGEDV